MGIGSFLKRGVQEMMIARPDEAKDFAIYKHPDQTIPNYAQLTVDSDEVAVFFKDGKVEGKLPPGRHTLNSSNIPFLSNLVDSFTGGNVLIAEVFFVSTRQFSGIKFGGRIGSVEDPKSGVPVETLVHGDFALQVFNPEQLIIGLVGMQQSDNESFFNWFKQQVLKVIRDQIAELVVKEKWPLLDVVSGAYTEEIEVTVLEGVRSTRSTTACASPRWATSSSGSRKRTRRPSRSCTPTPRTCGWPAACRGSSSSRRARP